MLATSVLEIASALNRAPVDANDVSVLIRISKTQSKRSVIPGLLKILSKSIFCTADGWNEISSIAEGEEPTNNSILTFTENETEFVIMVRPAPLNCVAFVSLPFRRSESQPIPVEMRTWGVALGRVPWHRLVEEPAKYREINVLDAGRFRLHHCIEAKHRFSESKTPKSLDMVSNERLLDYLRGSMTPMLNGLPANQTGYLWLGVDDETSVVVGIPSFRVALSVGTALSQYAKLLSPPLLASQIKVEIYRIDWAEEDFQWEDSQFLQISKAEGQALMDLYLGVCRIYEDDEGNLYAEVPKLVVDDFKRYFHENDVSSMSSECLREVLRKSQSTQRTLVQNRLSEWNKDVGENRDLWKLFDRCVVKISFNSDNHARGAYYDSDVENTAWKGHALLYSSSAPELHERMTSHQVWLRLKGLSYGAACSGVFSLLRGQNYGKLMLTLSTEEDLLKNCIHEYLDDQNVSFDHVLSDPHFTDDVSRKGYCLVTTYKAWGLCEAVYSRLRNDDFDVKILVFLDIVDAGNIEVINSLAANKDVVDVAILTAANRRGVVVNASVPASLGLTGWQRLFESVPRTVDPSATGADIDSICRGWINREVLVPTWEMVQKNYVMATTQCQQVRLKMEAMPADQFQHMCICQGCPGSGATAMMYRLAWDLQNTRRDRQNTRGAISFIVRKNFSSVALQAFLEHLVTLRGNVVTVFLDTDIPNDVREVMLPALQSTTVHVVEFIGGEARNCRQFSETIDPTLSDDDVETLSPILYSLFENAKNVLTQYKHYIARHPTDSDSRHIYVLMLMIIIGEFKPVALWFEGELRRLKEQDRKSTGSHLLQNLNFLALLTAYCPTVRSVSKAVVGNYEAFRSLVTEWRVVPTLKVSFCHPFLARKYLDQLLKTFPDEYPRLSSVLLEAETVANRLQHMESANFFRGLLQVRWPNNTGQFSMFVLKLIEGNDTDALIKHLLDGDRCPIESGHRWILLSRLFRDLGRCQEAVDQARRAESKFRCTDKHFLACSNLGEALGAMACSNPTDNEEVVEEMKDWFSFCGQERLIGKWMERIRVPSGNTQGFNGESCEQRIG